MYPVRLIMNTSCLSMQQAARLDALEKHPVLIAFLQVRLKNFQECTPLLVRFKLKLAPLRQISAKRQIVAGIAPSGTHLCNWMMICMHLQVCKMCEGAVRGPSALAARRSAALRSAAMRPAGPCSMRFVNVATAPQDSGGLQMGPLSLQHTT